MTLQAVSGNQLRMFILAGEPSADRIGADLVRRLKDRVPLALSGVGGDELIGQGLKSLFPMSDLAVMGVSDVLRRLPLLLWRIEQTARAIRAAQPDIVVLVDAQDFSSLLARRLRAMGYRKDILLYVAPSVWARSPGRAAKLKPNFNEVLAVLPFEPDFMAKLGGPITSYVGHPALAERLTRETPPDTGPLILLPGSRDGELRRHLPVFKQVAERLKGHPAITSFAMPTLRGLVGRLKAETADWAVPVDVVGERSERVALYGSAVAALAVSGTVTLEIGLARLPHVVTYIMDSHQARTYIKIGTPKVSLPNIILDRIAVPEFVTDTPDVEELTNAIRKLLDDKQVRQAQIAAFNELSDLMEFGVPGTPRQDPADRVLAHWTPA